MRKSDFCKMGHDTRIKGGRSSSGNCKECHWIREQLPENKEKASTRGAKYYEDHQEEAKEWQKAYNLTPSGKFSDYKASAKNEGRTFNITFEEFKYYWQKPCIVGCKITTIGLDRIDNSRGYEIDNIRPMCIKHNTMKNEFTDEDVIELGNILKKLLIGKAVGPLTVQIDPVLL